MDDNAIRVEDYTLLKNFRMEVEIEEGGNFCFSFWVYLINNSSAPFPATIIRQVHSDTTSSSSFIVLNEKKKMMLLPLLLLNEEAPDPNHSTSLIEVPHALMEIEFPMGNWVHVACEVFIDVLRIHMNGEIVGERLLSSSFSKDYNSNGLMKITLIGADGGDSLQGYVHNAEVLPLSLSIKNHYFKDPPLQLSIDNSSTSEIEEGSDGIWSIVGGKASCRRIFSLDVVLLNAISQAINKELEVVASLLFADNGLPVEKTSDDEAPLLTTYDGIEFSSCDKPSKLLLGRASFKLKISQLSSKCDNRLFHIKFEMPKFGGYHFLEAFSHPIRCISRSRNPRTSSLTWKRPTSSFHPLNGSQSIGLHNGVLGSEHTIHEIKPSPPLKKVKLWQAETSPMLQPDEECNSHVWAADQVENGLGIKLECRPENLEEADNSLSDSESSGGKDSHFGIVSSRSYSISDLTIFKYCLGGLVERALLLKEIATSASEEELLRFGNEVSLYSGCSHHRCQIVIAKRLIEEGTKVWNLIAQNKRLVRWENAIFEIEDQFMKIACCSSRSLTEQDFKILRRIAECGEYIAQENFEKMWCWLYPIAFTLSRDWINTMWNCTSPRWIEGFITKEDAELSLQGPKGLQEPGTFILRFPTSRSWPHPDAGSLIVTYVGSNYTLRHRLLSLDYIYSCEEKEVNAKPVQDLLLAEPELSRLGRIVRNQQPV